MEPLGERLVLTDTLIKPSVNHFSRGGQGQLRPGGQWAMVVVNVNISIIIPENTNSEDDQRWNQVIEFMFKDGTRNLARLQVFHLIKKPALLCLILILLITSTRPWAATPNTTRVALQKSERRNN